MRAFFTVTVFLSAFVLFVIEPIAGKMLLPMFGGSANVWTAAMVFFQVALLAGYAYSNWASSRPLRQLGVIQLATTLVATITVAVTLGFAVHASEMNREPGVLQVAWTLAMFVGPPFALLAATAPLLQRTFALSNDPMRANPYFLYAASNAGSLLGLLCYPVLIEPYFGVALQFSVWVAASKIVMLLTLMCIVFVATRAVSLAKRSGAAEELAAAEVAEPPTTMQQRLLWLALAAAPSSLLLGVTQFLTTSVAPIPLLWVVPLALYLTTFIVAFAHKPRVTATSIGRWLAVAVTPLALALILESATPIVPLALLHLGVTFMAMLACHLRLSESRPGPGRVTEFYLWLAAGGAVGGLFNALVAPKLFTTLFEYPLALAMCCVLAVVAKPTNGKTWEKSDWRWPIGIGLLTGGVMVLVNLVHMPPSTPRTILTIGLPAILCFVASGRPIRYGLSLLALFAAAALGHVSAGGKVLFTARSFYGVHRVVEDSKAHLRKLVHGNTVHGMQNTLPDMRSEPLTYYGRMGPAGLVMRTIHKQGLKPNIGLVGLGVGSLAAYGDPGQNFTFFEIDPVVIHVATNPKLFTFMSDSKANVQVVQGDGRLTLKAQPNGAFGMLVLDAFTSDSIPVHLLTEEAIRLYMSKLTAHGVLLFHVSNNYLDLAPILAAEARDLNLQIRLNDDTVTSDQILSTGVEPSKWVLIARNDDDFVLVTKLGGWEHVTPAKRGWTDDFSNILSAFRLGGDNTEAQ